MGQDRRRTKVGLASRKAQYNRFSGQSGTVIEAELATLTGQTLGWIDEFLVCDGGPSQPRQPRCLNVEVDGKTGCGASPLFPSYARRQPPPFKAGSASQQEDDCRHSLLLTTPTRHFELSTPCWANGHRGSSAFPFSLPRKAFLSHMPAQPLKPLHNY